MLTIDFFLPPPQLLSRLACSSLLLIFFLLPKYANAQDDCLDWNIEISAYIPSNITGQLGASPDICEDDGACDNLYYYVSLIRTGSENDSVNTNYIHFRSLNFSGSLDISPGMGAGTARTFSHLDADASLTCSPAGINDGLNPNAPLASWDPDGHFSYSLSNANGSAFTLHGADVCIESIQFFDASLRETNATNDCTPLKISTEVVATNQLCLQNFSVYFKKQYYPLTPPSPIGIEGVNYTVKADGSTCEVTGISNTSGYDTKCLCTEQKQILSPTKDVNPLNGVSTYDLVLISRHILGLEAFANPYKMVAADANKNNNIATSDIVELRKLILGIYQTLPGNTSWRFIPQAFVFPNFNNAFATDFPDITELELPLSFPGEVPIYGIKVGDVNGNVLASLTGSGNVDRDGVKTLPLGFLPPSARRGQTTDIPIFVRQATDLAAWQLALRYDPTQMKIKNVRWAMAAEPPPYEMADWHSPVPGELRLCWFDPTGAATHLDAQAPIAYVQVEWLGNPARDAHTALELIQTIAGEAYGSDGQVSNLMLEAVSSYQAPVVIAKAVQPKPEWVVSAYPNPTDGIFRFEVSLPGGGEGRIGLYDPMGRLVSQQDISFTPGLNVVTSQQFPPLTTGIYFVRFDTPMGRQTLRLVKN